MPMLLLRIYEREAGSCFLVFNKCCDNTNFMFDLFLNDVPKFLQKLCIACVLTGTC